MTGSIQPCFMDPCPQLAADQVRIKRLQDDAKLADAVYEADPAKRQLPEGFREITDPTELAQYNLTKGMLDPASVFPEGHPEYSQFRAGAFQGPDGTLVVAFKGTSPTSLSDWGNNAAQELAGRSDYYTRAQRIASNLQKSGAATRFTGHSLGGGLASAAARTAGADASTFNAAGLNPDTVLNRSPGGHIDRVFVKGDIVTAIQKGPASRAASDRNWALDPPKGIGARVIRALGTGVGALLGSLAGGPFGGLAGAAAARGVILHGMGSVHDSLQLKADDIARERAQKCG